MLEPSIVYEDKNFLAVNKPSGWLTHHVGHGKEKAAKALTDWLLLRYPELRNVGDPSTSSGQVDPDRPGIVHRLDQDTSGIILVPKTQEYFLYLKSLFQAHRVMKTYLALTHGVPKEKKGKVELPIGIKPGTIRRTVRGGKMQKPAVTEYKVVKVLEDSAGEQFSLVEVNPETGRTHQIRVHLKSLGTPIAGDKIYGMKKDTTPRLMLHAEAIELEPSPGKRLKIEADPPEDFKAVIRDLKYPE